MKGANTTYLLYSTSYCPCPSYAGHLTRDLCTCKHVVALNVGLAYAMEEYVEMGDVEFGNLLNKA